MLGYISKRMSKQQKSNLVALAISLVVVGGIALNNQQQCWDNNGFANGKGTLKNLMRNLSSTCVNKPYQGFTPPTEISGMVYVPSGGSTSQSYWQSGNEMRRYARQQQSR